MAQPTPTPTTFRASIRIIEPLVLGLAGIAALSWWLELTLLPWVAGGLAVIGFLASVSTATGRVTVDAEGIRGRYLLRRINVRWPDVWALTARNGLLRRTVLISVQGQRKPRILPAPLRARSAKAGPFTADVERLAEWSIHMRGPSLQQADRARPWAVPVATALICLAATMVDKPWYWLPGPEVQALPEPCAVVGDARHVPGTRTFPDGEMAWCDWGNDRASGNLTYLRFEPDRLISGSGVAAQAFSTAENTIRRNEEARVSGAYTFQVVWVTRATRPWPEHRLTSTSLGDDGMAAIGEAEAIIVVRRANVMIYLWYESTKSASLETDALAMAEAALDQLTLS